MRIKFLTILLIGFSSGILAQKKAIFDIFIEGNQKTKTGFITSILYTKKGQQLDSLQLEKDMVQLKRLPALSHAYYQVNSIDDANCTITVFIEENFTVIPEVNFWTFTNNQFSYRLGVYDYNFLGRNIAFGGFYQFNGFDTYAINFRAPNLFSNKWGLAINHQNWKSEEPLFFNNSSANYLYNNNSVEVLGLYQLNVKHQFTFGVNLFREKYQYLSGATSPAVPQSLTLNKLLFKGVHFYDGLDYFYQYLDGFKNIFYLQYVVTENDFQNEFIIFWNDFFYFKRIGERGNWANRFRFGLSSNEMTPFAPFALDNNVNLRGVGILVDRGTGSMVWNTEYRHTIYDKKWLAIQTNVFTDIGSWRNPGGQMDDFFQHRNIRIYSGFGLRFISKKIYNATFRIDYGFRMMNSTNNSQGGFVFGVGQYF